MLRAAKGRVRSWLLAALALVASPALATAPLPSTDPLREALDRAAIDALAEPLELHSLHGSALARKDHAKLPATTPTASSRISLTTAEPTSYRGLIAPAARPLPPALLDVELRISLDLPSLPKPHVGGFDLFGSASRLCSSAVSRANATGFALCLAPTRGGPFASFLSEDPLAGEALEPPSLHRYLYVVDRPTVLVDPTGEATIEVFGSKVEVPDVVVNLGIERIGEGIGYVEHAAAMHQTVRELERNPEGALLRVARSLVMRGPELANRMVQAARRDGLRGLVLEREKLKIELAEMLPGGRELGEATRAGIARASGNKIAAGRHLAAARAAAVEDTVGVLVAGAVVEGAAARAAVTVSRAAEVEARAAADLAVSPSAARGQGTLLIESSDTPGVALSRGGVPPADVPPGMVTEPAPPLGGAYTEVPARGGQVHHSPADSVSPLSRGRGPGFRMETPDHLRTASWGRSKEAQAFRARQAELIKQGQFEKAQQLDIEDVRAKFGPKYEEGIRQMEEYTKKIDPQKLKPKPQKDEEP